MPVPPVPSIARLRAAPSISDWRLEITESKDRSKVALTELAVLDALDRGDIVSCLKAVGKVDEADKVHKRFGMKTPLGGIGEGGEDGGMGGVEEMPEDVD